MPTRTIWRILVFGAVLALLVSLILATLFLPTVVGWDPSHGILAAMQYEAGISPDIRTLVMVDPTDLSHDRFVRITWWPPSYQTVPFAFRSMGMPWGNALRATIIACLLVGTAGWAFYFRLYISNPGSAGLLLLIMLCSSYVFGFAERYAGGDLLLWTVTPYLMVVNLGAFRIAALRAGLLLAFAGGFTSAAIYWVKYGGLFLGIGLGSAWGWLSYFEPSKRSRFAAWLLGFGCGAALLLRGGMFGGDTPASQAGRAFKPLAGLTALGIWPTTMTDLAWATAAATAPFGLLRNRTIEVIAATGWIILAGLFVLAFVRGAFLRQQSRIETKASRLFADDARTMLLFVVSVDTALYASIVCLGGVVALVPRLARMSGLVAMPAIFAFVTHCVCVPHKFTRPIAAILIVVLFVVPPELALYRFVKDIGRRVEQRELFVSDYGLQPDMRVLHVENFVSEVRSHLASEETVLDTASPSILLCIPRQRFLIVNAMNMSSDDLRSKNYRGLPPKGVALLLPQSFAAEGKLDAIRSSFTDVVAWDSIDLHAGPDWTLSISQTE